MDDVEVKGKIQSALKGFSKGDLFTSSTRLFNTIGYSSRRFPVAHSLKPAEFLENYNQDNRINPAKALCQEWQSIHFVFQLTGDEIRNSAQLGLGFGTRNQVDTTIIESYLFFALELFPRDYTRTELADLTRQINKAFDMPVMLLFKYGDSLTLAVIDRRLNKIDPNKDVLKKVTLIKNINFASPHRAHIEILFDLSIDSLYRKHGFTNFVELHRAWEKTLDSSELNKAFFKELSNWYFWALQHVIFPKDAGDDEEVRNATSVIRLLTRLIFIWFIKEKGLVPDNLFNSAKLKNILKYVDPQESTYYKAILQNLFFATLNQEMNAPEKPDNRKFRGKTRQPDGRDQHFGITNLYRYEDYFQNPEEALKLLSNVPFLNGGLFECLDKPDKDDLKKMVRIDGFSDRKDNEIRVPDYLFFSGDRRVDLSAAYGQKNKIENVCGLINLLDSYKFTINENTPIEEEVALDPELLGRVFENLLASYNPETQTTARKSTGSYYTPREIVNYMVDESLIAYLADSLKKRLPEMTKMEGLEDILREVFAYKETQEGHYFNAAEISTLIEAIDNVKVLDPACGSGAFPMGILHKLVFILSKLDPHNQLWKDKQLAKAAEIQDPINRDRAIADIEESFQRNEMDYGRKLYLIQSCIYGVDIQPIAAQISKLRFFISLIVDQKLDDKQENRGILPLPNLETKFVAANTLIGLDKPKLNQQVGLRSPAVVKKEEDLVNIRRNHFAARTPATKLKYREADKKTRKELAELLKNDGFPGKTAVALAEWDPYDQNASSNWFDPEWMFGIEDGFDIVMANPPWISNDNLTDTEKNTYKRVFEVATGRFDIANLFVEKGTILLKQSCSLFFVMPEHVWLGEYFGPFREYLARNAQIVEILSLKEEGFEQTADPASIFLMKKTPLSSRKQEVSLGAFDLKKGPECFSAQIDISQRVIFDEFTQKLTQKLKQSQYVPLDKLAIVTDGIQTANLLKVIFTQQPQEQNRYHKALRSGKAITFRYAPIQWEGWWVVKPEHTRQYKRPGFSYDSPKRMRCFNAKKKIILRQTEPTIFATLDTDGYYFPNSIFQIAVEKDDQQQLGWLLGILNSRFLRFYYSRLSQVEGTTKPQIYLNLLKSLPVPVDFVHPIPQIVTQILAITKDEDYLSDLEKQAKVKELECQIDQLVYKLYGLTEEEIAVVEGRK